MKITASSNSAVIFVFVTVFLDMVGFGVILPVLPKLISTVGQMTVAEAASVGGWMFFAFSLTQFLFGPTLGNLSDAFGRRPLLLLAVFGLFVDYLIMSFAPNLAWLFVGRAIAGLCGASYVIANAYIADVTPPDGRGKAFGLMGAAFGLGFVVGPALGGILGSFGARVPFYAAAGVAAVNLAYGYLVLPETLDREKRRPFDWARANPFGTFKVFKSYGGVLPLGTVMFVYFFASAVYPAIWPFWSIAKFGWSELLVGLTLAAFGVIAAFFQGVLTGPVEKRLGAGNVVVLGLATAVVAVVGFGLAPGMLTVIALFLLHGPEGFVHPMLTALMSKAVPENAQGELQGGISSIMAVSMLVGTVFYSQIFSWFAKPNPLLQSVNVAMYVAAGFLALSLVLFLRVRRQYEKNR